MLMNTFSDNNTMFAFVLMLPLQLCVMDEPKPRLQSCVPQDNMLSNCAKGEFD